MVIRKLGNYKPTIFKADQSYYDKDAADMAVNFINCLKHTNHYQTGHPHGYLNAMYMGELAVCNVLSDPEGTLSELKKKTEPYPENFQEAMIQYFSFEASFSLMFMEANANKDDISYVMGHCFRSISCLNQVIFAKNKVYCINEKKAVAMIQDFSIKPINYKKRIDEIVSLLSTDKDKTNQAVNNLKELIFETEAL